MKYKKIIVFGLFFVTLNAYSGESYYVTDKLLLGMYKEKEGDDKPFKVLQSGALLEVIEKADPYFLVRTVTGEEGWVKASYLVKEEPAVVKIKQMEGAAKEQGELQQTMSKLEQEKQSLVASNTALQERIETLSSRQPEQTVVSDDTEQAAEDQEPQPSPMVPLPLLAVVLGAFGLGFYLGMKWLDRRVRNRLGGYRFW